MHEGHRSRMLERVGKFGLESLQEHEQLEVLLFLAIPRKNTNETAHRLLNKFGSFANVLDADISELMTVEGIGIKAATVLKMMPEFFRTYEMSQMRETTSFDSVSIASEYGRSILRGEMRETAYAVLLDNKLSLIDKVKISSGNTRSVEFDLRKLYQECINKSAAAVILYHNHPHGLSVPSRSDIETTTQIEMKLADIGVVLIEHFIVAGSRVSPIMKLMQSYSRIYVKNSDIGAVTIEYFYDR